jgi:hypothetical protein
MKTIFIVLATLAYAHIARPDNTDNVIQSANTQTGTGRKPDNTPCEADGKTYQIGDRICAGKTNTRVCNWGGEWVDFPCTEGTECEPLPPATEGGKSLLRVQCFRDDRKPYPTGPNGEVSTIEHKHATGGQQTELKVGESRLRLVRRRRATDEKAAAKSDTNAKPVQAAPAEPANDNAAAAVKPDNTPCEANGKTFTQGDWYCGDKTTTRVCSWRGEWFDFKCDEGAECMVLPTDAKKVQCFKFNEHPYETGPNGEKSKAELHPASGGSAAAQQTETKTETKSEPKN